MEPHANKRHYERIPSIGESSLEDTLSVEKGTFFVYYLVFCVCIGGFLFGYDTGGKEFVKIVFFFYVCVCVCHSNITYLVYSDIRCLTANAKRLFNVHETKRIGRICNHIWSHFFRILCWARKYIYRIYVYMHSFIFFFSLVVIRQIW